jgi:hypothetical protein
LSLRTLATDQDADPPRLGELLRAIDGYTGREAIGIALKLALLFFVRPGEPRQAHAGSNLIYRPRNGEFRSNA